MKKQINRLLAIATFGHHHYKEIPGVMAKIMGTGEDIVSFITWSVLQEFHTITNELLGSNTNLETNFSLNFFEEKIGIFLRKLHKENRACTNQDWEVFLKELLDSKTITTKIIAPIQGINLSQGAIQLGAFIVVKSNKLKELLKVENPAVLEIHDSQIEGIPHFIIVTVEAKDLLKCEEKAEKALRKFENIANFITGKFIKETQIGIFNYSSLNITSFTLTKEECFMSNRFIGGYMSVDLDNIDFHDSENALFNLWHFITANTNALQAKILDAAEWAGKAFREQDDAKSLIQFIIAIESLLQYQEDIMVNPSIVSQLSDMIAFLLGENYEERIEYARYIKDLYSKRSAIVHGGITHVNYILLHTANVLCHKIIRILLSEFPFNEFKTKKELCQYLSRLKYGKPNKK